MVYASHPLASPRREIVCTYKRVHRVFDARVAPEPAYPSLVPSIAETAYYEDFVAGRGVSGSANDGERGNNEEVKILHAPPG